MANPLSSVTRGDDDQPIPRVYIDTSDNPVPDATGGGNALAQVTGPAAAPQQQWTMEDLQQGLAALADYVKNGQFSPGTKVGNRLFGTGGEERYQMWPEKMVRSALAAPGEALASTADNPVTSENAVAPAQDIAGMASGSTLFAKPGVGTLGSGPLRPGARPVPTVAEATQWAKEAVAATGERWENYTPAQQQEWVRRGYDQLEQKASRDALANPAPVFYSALEHAATNAAQDVMSPQQWLGYLKNQPGVKAEELAWTGIENWLAGQKGKVKKEDVKAYLDEHKVEIKDVTKGKAEPDEAYFQDTVDEFMGSAREHFYEEHQREPTTYEEVALRREIEEDVRLNGGDYDDQLGAGDAKYSSYQLPGGENYREHLLTMPRKVATTEEIAAGKASTDESGNPVSGDAYKSSHWDEPNVLAHVRTNDRTIGATPISEIEAKIAAAVPGTKLESMASGMPSKLVREGIITPQEAADWSRARGYRNNGFEDKPGTGQKSLHIEEIQSDWHQQGRKQGYKEPDLEKKIKDSGLALVDSIKAAQPSISDTSANTMAHDLINKVRDGGRDSFFTKAEHDLAQKYIDLETHKMRTTIPDAPFKTTWPELALKRMIRHAAENGYDRISWTPGEAQAARYDLSKHLNKVQYHADRQRLVGIGKDGGVVMDKEGVAPEQVADYIGKDAAQKLLDSEPAHIGKIHELRDADLKVGGEGMREFYDKMLPKMAEKIGKAHEVKVQKGTLPGDFVVKDKDGNVLAQADEAQIDFWLSTMVTAGAKKYTKERLAHDVHYFDLPQSLKDHAIGKGFPLYMSGVPFPLTPVDHDPFAKKKDKK